jgi:hypothetical protein
LENIIKSLKSDLCPDYTITTQDYEQTVNLQIIPARFNIDGTIMSYPSSLLIYMPDYLKYNKFTY